MTTWPGFVDDRELIQLVQHVRVGLGGWYSPWEELAVTVRAMSARFERYLLDQDRSQWQWTTIATDLDPAVLVIRVSIIRSKVKVPTVRKGLPR